MPLSPYLSFAGNCSDAIAYYQRTLGAELLYNCLLYTSRCV